MIKKYSVKVNGISYEVEIEDLGSGSTDNHQEIAERKTESLPQKKEELSNKAENSRNVKDGIPIKAPMPGKVLSIKCSEDALVKKGDVLIILESMKMENEITASKDGKILSINVSEGETVQGEDTLVILA